MYLIELKEHQNCMALVGRSLLAMLFIMSAFLKMLNWQACLLLLANTGLPMAPQLLAVAVAVELVGGFALMIGVLSRLAALVLIVYLIPVTAIMHNFWAAPPDQAVIALTEFVKNIAIMGGLFLAVAFGPGTHVVREPQANVRNLKEPDRKEKPEEKEDQKPTGLAGAA